MLLGPMQGGPDMQQPPAAKRQSLHEHECSTRDGQPAGAATTAGGLLKYEAQQQQVCRDETPACRHEAHLRSYVSASRNLGAHCEDI